MSLVYRYNVEASAALGKPGVPEFPLVIQDMVVDTPIAGDPAGVCRLKYDRKPGGGFTQLHAPCQVCMLHCCYSCYVKERRPSTLASLLGVVITGHDSLLLVCRRPPQPAVG